MSTASTQETPTSIDWKPIIADVCAAIVAVALIWRDGTVGMAGGAAIGGALVGLHLGALVGP